MARLRCDCLPKIRVRMVLPILTDNSTSKTWSIQVIGALQTQRTYEHSYLNEKVKNNYKPIKLGYHI